MASEAPAAPLVAADPPVLSSVATSLDSSASASACTEGSTGAAAAPQASSATDSPAAAAQGEGASASADASSSQPPLSKSALKRQRKQEAFQAQKLQRRAYEKEKRKAKAAEVKRLVQEGKMEAPQPKKKRVVGKQEPHGARVVIDMGFDELMTDKEVKSMSSQLAYCYSANRNASHPFPLLITSFNGRLRQGFDKRGDATSWKGVEWWDEGVEQLYEGVPEPAPTAAAAPEEVVQDGSAENGGAAQPVASTSAAPSAQAAPTPADVPLVTLGTLRGRPRARVPRSTVVYLTGDSPNVLSRLEAGHTYILGGIVDRNRYKNLCLDKANKLGIQHAQLPIGEFLPEMQTRKVLTVNQVFEILVGWVEEGERSDGWREALRRVMPERKFDADGKKKRRAGAAGDADEGAADDAAVYVAQDDEDEDAGGDVEMLVEQVDAAREEAEQAEEEEQAEAVVANVDEEAKP
ncbi:hypothetical protein Rhopal_005013-T1 [Rhodotorula paludigena]|uniref:tRNA (guanine(9)-N1)-methyltransferase n=1 Tax=Rhodotorula paludigena TaxID=86838 RepID=A0AAV5GH95_9BASI|nr:hypothetical protein Rhopal_005013-T1 [Rhodotorula paludigena]